MRVWFLILLCLTIGSNLLGQNALRDAELLSKEREYVSSSEQLLAFIDTHPERKYDLGRAWSLHSYNLLQQGKTEQARTANEKSFELRRQLRSPAITENYLRLAQIDMEIMRYGDALAAAQQGMQMLIENPRIYADLNLYAAKALQKLGRTEEADAYFSTARDVLLIEVGTADEAYAQLLYQGALMREERQAYAEAFKLVATAYYAAQEPLFRTRLLIKAYQLYRLK
ncbi:MAG: hypothetical protein AAFN81_23360 [Bacteroidota bacterium]